MKIFNFSVKGINITVNSFSGNTSTMVAKVNNILEYKGKKYRKSFLIENGFNYYCNELNENKVIEYISDYFSGFEG